MGFESQVLNFERGHTDNCTTLPYVMCSLLPSSYLPSLGSWIWFHLSYCLTFYIPTHTKTFISFEGNITNLTYPLVGNEPTTSLLPLTTKPGLIIFCDRYKFYGVALSRKTNSIQLIFFFRLNGNFWAKKRRKRKRRNGKWGNRKDIFHQKWS